MTSMMSVITETTRDGGEVEGEEEEKEEEATIDRAKERQIAQF